MVAYAQETRYLELDTPLGKDVLLLQGVAGEEAISRLSLFRLDLLGGRDDIAPADIVGKSCTVKLRLAGGGIRHFNGICNRFGAGAQISKELRAYRAELVPWLWFLTRTSDCRIFQSKAVPDILKEVFGELGFSDYKLDLKGSHPKRDYCVQYRETDFAFVSRLMEEEGIFYFFKHENGRHTMILADHKATHQPCEQKEVEFSEGSRAVDIVSDWQHHYEFRSGKWAHTDYNFETPSTSLLTSTNTLIKQPQADKYEIYDYPGNYGAKSDGEASVKLRMEEEEAGYDLVEGASRCATFTPGAKFTLTRHSAEKEAGKTYVVTAIRHDGFSRTYLGGQEGAEEYRNSFTCIPDSVTFRPPRTTPKREIVGIQTAVVVGPSGEEIYPDKYGRIKVQFHWDRYGKKDEKSSCWIRVAHNMAGANWGLTILPRMGQEVVVSFLEGDPDRPLVIGMVYNAEQMPPYDLPGNKTQSGFKTRSSLGGGAANFNELRFEDKKGSEQVFLHAEKNQDIEVENDETHWVGHDRTKTIDHDETSHIKHDRTETVDNNETITVHANRTETVDKNETITINMSRTEQVALMETIAIGINRAEVVGGNEEIGIGKNRSLTVGKNQSISVGSDETTEVGSNRTEKVGKDEAVTVGKNRTHKVGENDSLEVGKVLKITVGDEILMKTGSAELIMKKNGDITINGKNITIKGSGDVIIKGKQILEN